MECRHSIVNNRLAPRKHCWWRLFWHLVDDEQPVSFLVHWNFSHDSCWRGRHAIYCNPWNWCAQRRRFSSILLHGPVQASLAHVPNPSEIIFAVFSFSSLNAITNAGHGKWSWRKGKEMRYQRQSASCLLYSWKLTHMRVTVLCIFCLQLNYRIVFHFPKKVWRRYRQGRLQILWQYTSDPLPIALWSVPPRVRLDDDTADGPWNFGVKVQCVHWIWQCTSWRWWIDAAIFSCKWKRRFHIIYSVYFRPRKLSLTPRRGKQRCPKWLRRCWHSCNWL